MAFSKKSQTIVAVFICIAFAMMGYTLQFPNNSFFTGQQFNNLHSKSAPQRGWLDVWKWRFTRDPVEWPNTVHNNATPQIAKHVKADETFITYINHSTDLIQLPNLNVLTDPMFSEQVSPFPWISPKRVRAPGLELSALPKVNVVIVSHNHYDHMDLPSLKALKEKDDPIFIVPLNNAKFLQKVGIKKIIELNWWQSYAINGQQSVTLIPAVHWSQRTLFDKNESLWGSFLITSQDLKIFFSCDTGYNPEILNDIKKRIGAVDVALLPIGSYKPQWFMKMYHLNPEEAVIMHLGLGAKLSLGIHFHTFQLSDEGYDEPVNDLKKALHKYQLARNVFIAPENGQTLYYQKQDKA